VVAPISTVQLTAIADSAGAADDRSGATVDVLALLPSDGAVGIDVPQATAGSAMTAAMMKRPVRVISFLLGRSLRSKVSCLDAPAGAKQN
jgi:hypothetical protein